MNIEEIIEKMDWSVRSCTEPSITFSDVITLLPYINQLEADKLVAYRAIVEFNRMYKFETGEEILKESVLKAEDYIREVTK